MRQLSRLSLRDLLYILFRDKNKIALIVLVSLIGTGVHLALRDTVYKAESRLLVTLGKEKLAGIEAYNKDNYNILFQERGQDVHNGIEIMKDPHFAYSVLARIKPLLKPEEPPSGSFAAPSLRSEARRCTVAGVRRDIAPTNRADQQAASRGAGR